MYIRALKKNQRLIIEKVKDSVYFVSAVIAEEKKTERHFGISGEVDNVVIEPACVVKIGSLIDDRNKQC